ncbi:MAG: hypothetical protein ACK5S5_01685 [Planctomycetota bacterium]|jgi:hypothetical protein
MATNPVQTPSDSKSPPEAQYDEHSGVYGFFRRNQKRVLYTAGLFTLLTFSITGPMTALITDAFRDEGSKSTILVNGKREALTAEDITYGRELAGMVFGRLPFGVLPPLDAGKEHQGELGTVYAILRRAAIAEGLGASFAEVDRAIEAMREQMKSPSVGKLVSDLRFASIAQYRDYVAEAMRIGAYVRLQTLALDSTEARVLAQTLSDREKITLRVASFEEKKVEEDLKKASPLSEDDLKKWLDGKDEREKRMMQAYDAPRAELRFGGFLTAEGQFDPEQWKDAELKDFTISDDQLKSAYEQEKEARFKLEGDGQFKPADDPAVKAELTRVLQAEQVLNKLLAALREKQDEAAKAQNEAVAAAQADVNTANYRFEEATLRLDPAKKDLESKLAELKQKPDDAALKDAAAKLQAEVDAMLAIVNGHDAAMVALKAAVTAAEKAVEGARATFDFPAAFAALTGDKKGVVAKAMQGRKSGDEMKDLDALGLDLGKWPTSSQGAGLRTKGDIAFAAGRTTKAVVLYQAADVEPMPLKAWDALKPLAEGAYWTEQAKQRGESSRKKMDEALLRLAKEKIPARVAELEGERQKRIDDKVADWEKKTNDAIAQAEKELARLQSGTRMHAGWQQELDGKRAELAQREARRTAFTSEVEAAIKAEIATEAQKHYKDVLDAAAAEAGFAVADLGPLPRDLQERDPRFEKGNPPAVVYLWRNHAKLKEGEATGLIQDFAGRACYVAVCAKVEPLTAADVSRRDFESLRTGDGFADYAATQAGLAYRQAFTIDALEARYDLQREVGELEVQTPPAK